MHKETLIRTLTLGALAVPLFLVKPAPLFSQEKEADDSADFTEESNFEPKSYWDGDVFVIVNDDGGRIRVGELSCDGENGSIIVSFNKVLKDKRGDKLFVYNEDTKEITQLVLEPSPEFPEDFTYSKAAVLKHGHYIFTKQGPRGPKKVGEFKIICKPRYVASED